MKILVTGAAGFIGFHVANDLIKKGNEVFGIDNINSYYEVNLKKDRLKILNKNNNFFFKKLNIEDNLKIHSLFKKFKPDVVVHLAAQAGIRHSLDHPRDYFISNSLGTFNILDASKTFGIKHLVIASTSSIYGANTKIPYNEDMLSDHPIQFYAATKKNCETMAHSYSHLYKIPTTVLRFFTVYGPWGRPDMALFKFTKRILEGKPIEVFNNGNHKRDFTFVSDVSNVVKKIINKIPKPDKNWDPLKPSASSSSAPFKIFNVGYGKPIKLDEFILHLEKVLNKKANRIYKPYSQGEIIDTHSDTRKLEKYIGYKPKIDYKEGIIKFVEWYKSYY
ncbi:MAG: hypothetical protein CBE41_04135 [Gammaproteobacteria bacterium TMED281]|nr:MAG: hypothetical protein CBE41_04135 [Gammaproteobacteria bacterium TMED281]